jgi:hypothetical protein
VGTIECDKVKLGFSFDFHDDTDKLNPDYASACPADRKPPGGISFV